MSTTDAMTPPNGTAPAATESRPWATWVSGALRGAATSLLAIAAALVVGAIIILLTGDNPITAYLALLDGALGQQSAVANTLVAATPLAFGGLAFAVAARAGLFNIGVEGQLFLGSLAAGLVAALDLGLPTTLHITVTILAGMVAGGIWAGIPGVLLARTGASVVITTIMLNYISYRLSSWAITQEDWLPVETARNGTVRALETARFDILIERTRLHGGVILVPIVGVILWFVLFRTTFGYRVRTVGLSRGAAAYAGIPWGLTITLTMVVSGMLAGLAGAVEIAGVSGRHTNPNPGYGFTAIAVALAGRNHPIGAVVASLLFGILASGATRMQSEAGVSSNIVQILQALIILAVAASAAIGHFKLGRWFRPKRPLTPSSNSGIGTADQREA